MKSFRLGIFLIILFLCSHSLLAKESGSYELWRAIYSPFTSIAYHGSTNDTFSNPAAIALVDERASVMFGLYADDSLSREVLYSEKLGYLQSHRNDMRLAFMNSNMSLAIDFGTAFENRHLAADRDDPVFDIYSNVDLSLDVGYAFPYIALGLSIKGGNSMIRNEKTMTRLSDAFANAWFSPFYDVNDSQRFSLGGGLLLYFNNFSLALNTDEIVNLKDNSFHSSWNDIVESTTVAISVNGNRYKRKGDLSLFYPRVSVTYSGFDSEGVFNYMKLAAEVDLQFLPRVTLALGFSYLEREHAFFGYNLDNGVVSLYIHGEYNRFSLDLGFGFSTDRQSTFYPTLMLTVVN